MYGFTEKSFSNQTQIPAGKYENVLLTNIVAEPAKQDGTGGITLRFYFDVEGQTFIHTEFPVDAKHEIERFYDAKAKGTKLYAKTEAEAVKSAEEKVGKRIGHILHEFIPKEELLKIQSPTWDGYLKQLITVAGKSYETEKFRIIVVYTKKGFSAFPYTFPFIQNMNKPDTLKLDPAKHILLKPEVAPTSEDELEQADIVIDDSTTTELVF